MRTLIFTDLSMLLIRENHGFYLWKSVSNFFYETAACYYE